MKDNNRCNRPVAFFAVVEESFSYVGRGESKCGTERGERKWGRKKKRDRMNIHVRILFFSLLTPSSRSTPFSSYRHCLLLGPCIFVQSIVQPRGEDGGLKALIEAFVTLYCTSLGNYYCPWVDTLNSGNRVCTFSISWHLLFSSGRWGKWGSFLFYAARGEESPPPILPPLPPIQVVSNSTRNVS